MSRRCAPFAATAAVLALTAPALAQRARGIDVSAWQGNLTQTNWNSVAGSGIEFAFIRSSRGGTTGTYNQSTEVGTLSHRYDDPYYQQNITRARAAGLLAGGYHFARPDLVLGTTDMNGFESTATSDPVDEANHFIEQAGNTMRPGYLRPVFDLEGGGGNYTKAALTDYALAFTNRITAVTGVRPIVYINSSYANSEVDSRLNTHDLWLARYIDPDTVNVQTSDPPAAGGLPNVYGAWNPSYPTIPAVKPWDFWQYTSTGRVPGIGGGTANVDINVANGNIDWVRENFVIPAIWMPDASGQWTTASNWNGVTVLPTAADRVIANRTTANYTITLSEGTHAIRSLQMNESFKLTGGSLSVAQYANFSTGTSVTGGSLTADTILNTGDLVAAGGTIAANAITGIGFLDAASGTVRAGVIKQNLLGFSDGNVELTTSGTSVTIWLRIAPGAGTLDIGSGKLVVNYSTANPLEATRAALASGRIKSSGSAANVGVAYFLSTDLFGTFPAAFGGESVDSTALLLTRALRGDTDLSGTVDFADLVALAQSYNGSGRWRQGDFNYDGTINFADLVALAQNYNTSESAAAAAFASSSSLGADWALAQSMVPEPGIAIAAISSLALLARRR